MSGAVAPPTAMVGPNALIQMGRALDDLRGGAAALAVFARAGLAERYAAPPDRMIDEAEAAALFAALMAERPADWPALAAEAGARTADYIIANRIPAPVRLLLKALPRRAAARLLTRAIARHAWTFAGSGAFTATFGEPITLTIAANPLATPGCPWHAAVFARLYGALAAPGARVAHPDCCALGAPVCRFHIHLKGA